MPSLHSAGLLAATRLGLSLTWPDAFAVTPVRRNWATFRGSWSSPPEWRSDAPAFESDGDPWPINLVGHGLLGSELYLRHRETSHGPWVSLAATTAWSLVWEYGVEAWHKPPSGIDLAWTPLAGVLLGEARYRAVLGLRDGAPAAWRHVLLYVVDPLAQLERDLLGLPD